MIAGVEIDEECAAGLPGAPVDAPLPGAGEVDAERGTL